MMDGPTSHERRALLQAGAPTMATPVITAAAQPASSHKEAATFNLWVISDSHVGTDKAASEGIQHGLVGFKPPPVCPESLAEALRQSENGGAFGGPPIPGRSRSTSATMPAFGMRPRTSRAARSSVNTRCSGNIGAS
jgi:hypothetical protein